MQKYALRTMKITANHSIRLRTPIFYPPRYQNGIFDENFIQWNENEKKHASQINRILNIMTLHVDQINIENNEIWIKSWKLMKDWLELKIAQIENLSIENSSIGNSSNKLDKKLKTKRKLENHANLLKTIFKIRNLMVFYTDDAKILNTTGAAMVQFFDVETKAES